MTIASNSRLVQIGVPEVRPCGECTLCCKLLPITKNEGAGDANFPFDKPAGSWCPHCPTGRGGCQVFNTPEFPNLCATYLCAWKLTGKRQVLPEWCRPDKIRAIFHEHPEVPGFPGKLIFEVIVDSSQQLDDRLIPFLERGADVGLSFVLTDGDMGGVLTDNPDLRKALEAKWRRG